MTDEQRKCRHDMFTRLQDHKPVLEMNGKGFLIPQLKCEQCGVIFYILDSTRKSES